MLKNLFSRREDSPELLQSTDATSSSRAQAQAHEWATLGPVAVLQAGPAAQRYVSPAGSRSPVARRAVERITSNPVT